MDNDKLFFLPFGVFDGIGPMTFRNLMQHFKTAKTIWESADTEIISSPLPKHLHERFLEFRKKFNIDEYVERLCRNKIWFWTKEDQEYPSLLKEISDPPFVLFYKHVGAGPCACPSALTGGHGGPPLQNNINLCVVGSRKITNYGQRVIEELIDGLCGQNITIVSGLAYGVDAVAHKTALNNKLPTIAVLGCGLDIMYPRENTALAEEIISSGGFIVSEVPLGRFVTRGIFPARNRIISGMSQATLIIEAAEKSGSLITASYALDQGRDVLVVPGPIQSVNSTGIVSLLKKGATPIASAADILETLGMKSSVKFAGNRQCATISIQFDNERQKNIYKLLTENGLTHINEMARKLQLAVSELSSILTVMEIRGVVRNCGNLEYEAK
jgi:DNA processing protein